MLNTFDVDVVNLEIFELNLFLISQMHKYMLMTKCIHLYIEDMWGAMKLKRQI